MEQHGLVSIVIPVYNAEQFLSECIQSVMEQDYDCWELILVDDGSTDDSYKICLDFAKRDSRIHAVHNENHGVSYTRNYGMDIAKGEYVCFIDADDKVLPDYISHLQKRITETGADVVFCGHRFLYDDRIVEKKSRISPGCYCFDDLSCGAIDDGTLSGILFGSVCTAMYRRKFIEDFQLRLDPSVRRNEDGLFNLELISFAKIIAISDYTGYLYRQWKKTSKKHETYTVSHELNEVSDIIQKRCINYTNLDKQLKCRELSIIFWNVQGIKNVDMPIWKLVKQLKKYLSGTEFNVLYPNLNFSALNRYKKILIGLIYRKQYFLFILLIKYVKPILERRLKH